MKSLGFKDVGNLNKQSVVIDAFLNPFPYGSLIIIDNLGKLSLGKTFFFDMTFNHFAIVGET